MKDFLCEKEEKKYFLPDSDHFILTKDWQIQIG